MSTDEGERIINSELDHNINDESSHGLVSEIISIMNDITDTLYSETVQSRVYEENLYRRDEYSRIMNEMRSRQRSQPLRSQLDVLLGESFRSMLQDSLTSIVDSTDPTGILSSIQLSINGQEFNLDNWDQENVIVSLTEEQLNTCSTEFKCTEEYLATATGGTKKTCEVCLEDYKLGDTLTQLRCNDVFHKACITPWLLNHNVKCPNCNHDQRETCAV